MIGTLRALFAGFIACGVALGSIPARADDGAVADQAARNHYERGTTLYDAQRYEEAIAEFSSAYDLRRLPALLFDIGRCQERLERWAESADTFTRYLESASDLDAAERAELQSRIAVLRERAERARPREIGPATVSAPALAPSVARARSGRMLRLGAVLVGVSAAATAIIGTSLVLSVSPAYNRLETTCRQRLCGPADTAGLRAQVDAGDALFAVAGAAAIADVVLITIAARRGARRRALLAPGARGFAIGAEL
jgi:tetratricopeptide (TPR) repeat protein